MYCCCTATRQAKSRRMSSPKYNDSSRYCPGCTVRGPRLGDTVGDPVPVSHASLLHVHNSAALMYLHSWAARGCLHRMLCFTGFPHVQCCCSSLPWNSSKRLVHHVHLSHDFQSVTVLADLLVGDFNPHLRKTRISAGRTILLALICELFFKD